MQTFVTYCRVSTRHQKLDGLGMDSQKQLVAAYVARQGGQIVGEFNEVESGSKTDEGRPELAAALQLAKRTKSKLIVAKLDRLSRNAEFLLRLQNANVDFVCCDAPNVDRLTVGILALVAQREREMISERTKAALQAAKRRGVQLGSRNPQRQVALMVHGARKGKEAFSMRVRPIVEEIRLAGVTTLQGIADCLNRRGIATRQGKQWYPATVRNLIRVAPSEATGTLA